MIEPKDSLVEYYQSMVNESILSLLHSEEMTFEEEETEEDEEYELTEEELKEIEEYRRNKRLH